jgi:hypothetical protein
LFAIQLAATSYAVASSPPHAAVEHLHARRHRATPKVSVLVDPAAPIGPVVPDDFLGLSFESSELPAVAADAGEGDLVSLMRSLGPGLLRFGGISADTSTAWQPEGPLPGWAQTVITPQALAELANLVRATGWRVLLTVDLGHIEAAAAAQEAQQARTLLGGSLVGIAIGNEPDRYIPDGLRPVGWTLATYLSEAETYRDAIATAAPGVPIVGPDTSTGQPALPWLSGTASGEHPALLTEHFYPLSSCETVKPTLSDLVSPLTRAHETAVLAQLASISETSGVSLRIDETNDVSCHGQAGVSNVFASALWALDYVTRAMTSGVVGLNFHDLIDEPFGYSPLVADGTQELADGALHANPEWYALLATHELLGDRPVQASVMDGPRSLTTSAFLSPGGNLHVVLDNFAPTGVAPATIRLRVPALFRAGPILRLTAPGLRATSGVTLGGEEVASAGTWSPTPRLQRASSGEAGTFELTLPPSSAALVTLYR